MNLKCFQIMKKSYIFGAFDNLHTSTLVRKAWSMQKCFVVVIANDILHFLMTFVWICCRHIFLTLLVYMYLCFHIDILFIYSCTYSAWLLSSYIFLNISWPIKGTVLYNEMHSCYCTTFIFLRNRMPKN